MTADEQAPCFLFSSAVMDRRYRLHALTAAEKTPAIRFCTAHDLCHREGLMTPLERVHFVRDRMPAGGLFAEKTWRAAPQPFAFSPAHVALLEKLGLVLHRFNIACNLLYRQSAAGKAHPWVAPLLDAGKPPELVALSRHDKVKGQVPAVIRPDLVYLENGFALSELDSVPGGIGVTAWLQETYAELGDPVLGGADGMRKGFASILPEGDVLISEKSAVYRPEMEWLVGAGRVKAVENDEPGDRPAYRFFDAFEYPKLEKFRAGWQPGQPLTPPLKPYLEEKLWLALFWSRPLQEFWRQEIGEKGQKLLQGLIPYAWVLDPAPLPIHAVIPELNIQSWAELDQVSPEQRDLVLKISGFSEQAWEARGVHVESDMPAEEWRARVRQALADFGAHPSVLMRFAQGALVRQDYVAENDEIATLNGRARVNPCYFVANDRVTLGGVRVTLCPPDKKPPSLRDAVVSPGMGTAT